MPRADSWNVALPLIGIIVGAVVRVVRARITARRDIQLAQLALRDTEPGERAQILEKLARLKPFWRGGRP